MKAVIPVREGFVPLGSNEAIEAAGGRLLLVGDETAAAAEGLSSLEPELLELGAFAAGHFALELARLLAAEEVVVLPATPDGRDLAPRLAARLGRPLLANAISLDESGATVLRQGGRQLVELECEGAFVATIAPGRGQLRTPPRAARAVAAPAPPPGPGDDPVVLAVLAPDPTTVDLGEATRIISAGAGVEAGAIGELFEVADRLQASVGATRVVTDAGHIDHRRQIGTTGVSVNPRLYLAFGVSGAAQHVAGLGEPEHILSVNLDASCPMMTLSDLAIVSDAGETLGFLAELLAARRAS